MTVANDCFVETALVDRDATPSGVEDSRVAPSHSPATPVISLRRICKFYRSGTGETTQILKDLSLDIMPGTLTVISGVSGSGKTSLLRILGLLDGSFEGVYAFAGEPIEQKPDWYIDE